MGFTQRLPIPSFRSLALAAIFLSILLLSRFATTEAQSPVRNGTIPLAYGLLTQLRGPVTLVGEGVVAICGVEVQLTESTRIDERVGLLTDAGAWARVLASYEADQLLYAVRIKTIEPQPFIRVRGKLLSETPSDSFPRTLTVDGIPVIDDGSAHRAGHIAPGQRVDIKAECVEGVLTATQIVGKASPPGHNKPTLTHFVGIVQNELAADLLGEWIVGEHTVQVNEDTDIDESKGDAEQGAKVKVVAEVQDDDSLLALEIHVLPGKGHKPSE